MANPKEQAVTSIAQFVEAVEQILTSALIRQATSSFNGNWYRGVGRSKQHELKPSLYRHPKLKKVEELIVLERQMLDDFARQNVLHDSSVLSRNDPSDFRTLFYMQHYGVPTRLLDWTSNPLIALYFALTGAARIPSTDNFSDDAAVWVLDPVSWNERALSDVSYGKEGPLSLKAEVTEGYRPRELLKGALDPGAIKSLYEYPVAMLGAANNARMFAQRGVFTVFGKFLESMEVQYDKHTFPDECLVKLIVPKDQIGGMTTRLLKMGYTDSVSYPDLHGLAMEIKRSRGFGV